MSAELRQWTLIAALAAGAAAGQEVKLLRVPQGGLQPQALRDRAGTLHLLYFAGVAEAGDLYYVRRKADAAEFSAPVRVNSTPGAALAVGTIRGGQLALGNGGRAHVAWNGSARTAPDGDRQRVPMLYARWNGDGFEPQRNVIGAAYGLDGGGSLAADETGNVLVAWHAMAGAANEAGRRVFAVRSKDEGKTFGAESALDRKPAGACGCCGMKAWLDGSGRALALYRTARENVNRDMALLVGDLAEPTFRGRSFAPWAAAQCPMSSAFLTGDRDRVLAAWEQQGQVFFAAANPADAALGPARFPKSPEGVGERKHPTLALGADGRTLLAWTEGTGWNRGGRAAWQVFDPSGKPLGAVGRAPGVPTWSLVAAVANPDGGFTVIW